MNGMISVGRLDEFVSEVINLHNEEYKDKTLWDVWLHRVFDKSYNEFVDGLEGQSKAAPTKEETASIIAETQNMLNNFKPAE